MESAFAGELAPKPSTPKTPTPILSLLGILARDDHPWGPLVI